MARDVAELYAAEAEESGRPFASVLTEGTLVSGSAALIGQAVANLLDNAFKYTPKDKAVEVAVRHSGAWASLAVIDNGEGLSDTDKRRLVGRFARGDAARSQPGSGLGLALADAVARAHGGRLVLSDTPGGGLTARLELPINCL